MASDMFENETILIVDDDPITLLRFEELLEKSGFEVRIATSGREALKIAKVAPPNIIILDVHMPDLDGLMTCRLMKEENDLKDTPVLFVSSVSETESMIEGFECGGVDYITKPFRKEEVLARVKLHLKLVRYERLLKRQAESSEEKYQTLVENTKDIPYSADSKGRLTYLGRQAARYGIDPKAAVVKSMIDFVAPEDKDVIEKNLRRFLRTGEEMPSEFRIVAKGKTFWFEESSSVVRDDRGVIIGLSGMLRDITERKRSEAELKAAMKQITSLKEQLAADNVVLREEVRRATSHENIVGRSSALRRVLTQAEQVAEVDSAVLLLGETGTGKELLARAIHDWSARRHRPLISVNCAAIPPSLVESELFGREKGAYTGALSTQPGRFEAARGSTLFFDELAELPLEVQGKLLRVLEEGRYERLGSTRTLRTDVRIIAATNRDLEEEVVFGRFRQDLFFRLNVFPITMPPLRERRRDIPDLVWHFVREIGARMGKHIEEIPRSSLEALENHSWPGNVRELRNTIERAMILSKGPELRVSISSRPSSPPAAPVTLDETIRDRILEVLQQTGWRIRGPLGTAEMLGIKPTTLEAKMKKLGIQRPGSSKIS